MGKKKIRAAFRKHHESRQRQRGLTKNFQEDRLDEDNLVKDERVSGKGDLTRKRTVVGETSDPTSAGFDVRRDVDAATSVRGRVLSVHGLASVVRGDDGEIYQCAVRRLLKNLSTDQRHVVVAGDVVSFRRAGGSEGLIERIEPRHSTLCRTSKRRKHILVANIDQLLIISSAAEPVLKPNLIDRFLVEAQRNLLPAIICINKTDLVDAADLQPFAGVYGQMGYEVLLVSAATGRGIPRLRELVVNKQSVVAGQSGVGKSSLLNAIEPELGLRIGAVSSENQKGKHTTTVAKLIPLQMGGYVVDTPGIRQFQLWDVIPEEVAGYYRDIHPLVNLCRYPDCTHTHETDCAVKNAVADGRLDVRRYESYCHLFAGDV